MERHVGFGGRVHSTICNSWSASAVCVDFYAVTVLGRPLKVFDPGMGQARTVCNYACRYAEITFSMHNKEGRLGAVVIVCFKFIGSGRIVCSSVSCYAL